MFREKYINWCNLETPFITWLSPWLLFLLIYALSENSLIVGCPVITRLISLQKWRFKWRGRKTLKTCSCLQWFAERMKVCHISISSEDGQPFFRQRINYIETMEPLAFGVMQLARSITSCYFSNIPISNSTAFCL